MSYDAFISYSHAADGKLAPALHGALHKFAKPWYRLRALRIFRDHTSLAAESDLTGAITRALDSSSYFILFASPEAAASPWVAKEITYWLDENAVRIEPAATRILIVLTGGELAWDSSRGDFDWEKSNALPSVLKQKFLTEPLWTDLRWAKEKNQLSGQDSRFQSVVAMLSAKLQGKSLDEIYGDEVREHRGMLKAVALVISMIFIAFLGAVAGASFGFNGLNRAERGMEDALEASEVLVQEFAKGFEDYKTVDTAQTRNILERGANIVGSLAKQDHSSGTRRLAARTYTTLAEAHYKLRNRCIAMAHALNALEVLAPQPNPTISQRLSNDARRFAAYFGLLKKRTTTISAIEALPEQLEAYWTIGNSAWRLGEVTLAKRVYETGIAMAIKLDETEIDIKSLRYLALLRRQVASVHRVGKEFDQAFKELREVERLRNLIAAKLVPTDHTSRRDLADISLHFAYVFFAEKNYPKAISRLQQARTILVPLVKEAPDNRKWTYKLASVRREIGETLIKQNQFVEALQELLATELIHRQLQSDDKTDARRSRDLAITLLRKGQAFNGLVAEKIKPELNRRKAGDTLKESYNIFDALLKNEAGDRIARGNQNRVVIAQARLYELNGNKAMARTMFNSGLVKARELRACEKRTNRFLDEDIALSIKGLERLGTVSPNLSKPVILTTSNRVHICHTYDGQKSSNKITETCKLIDRIKTSLNLRNTLNKF